jgi:uncharacterized protein (TIGR03790 family)
MTPPIISRLAPRRPAWAAVFLLLGLMAAGAQSDTAETPPDAPGDNPAHAGDTSAKSAWPAPFLPNTNAASSSFLENHPEEAPPSLSLHVSEPAHEGVTSTSHFLFPEGRPDELPAHLLVVYNSQDPDSQSLANYYATRRGIPSDHVLGIACPETETITRSEYETSVREPIISYIFQKNWMERRSVPVRMGDRIMDLLIATRNEVWAMVLMRGVPLRIEQEFAREGSMEDVPSLKTNAAAVDSELAMLPIFGLPEGGFVPNVFFDHAGNGLVRAGPELADKLILVTRLDGPRPADVRRMIDDSLYAEENRLAGLAVVDSRGLTDVKNDYTVGDDWLRRSHEMLVKDGWPMKFDENSSVLPTTDPCNHVAIYLGWYHEGACGPWITPPNRFVRGAIAYHLHSFSATTVRSPTVAWVGPLIAHGAAATMGCVYEPYLDLTPHLDIFTRRLLDGDYFAEAAYASQKALSWMVTVVGDPLYRPFKRSIEAALADSGPESSDHYDWLLLHQVERGMASREIPDTVSSLEHYLDLPGCVAQEGLGDLLEGVRDSTAISKAERAFLKANRLATQPIDHIRIGLKLAQLYENHGQGDLAQGELNWLRERFPQEAPTFGLPSPLAPTGTESPSLTLRPSFAPAGTLTLPKPPQPPKPPTP